MENVRPILVDLNTLNFLGENISTDVISFVDNKNSFARVLCLTGKDRAKKTCSDNQIIIFQILCVPLMFV